MENSALASSDDKRCWDRTWKCLMCFRWRDSVVVMPRKLLSFPSCFLFVSKWPLCRSYLGSHLLSPLFWLQRSLSLWGRDNTIVLFLSFSVSVTEQVFNKEVMQWMWRTTLRLLVLTPGGDVLAWQWGLCCRCVLS